MAELNFIPSTADWKEINTTSEYTPWDPVDGETLTGKLEDTQYNIKYPNQLLYFILENGTGRKYLVYGSKVLDEKMQQVELNDFVKIVYNGRKQGAERTYKDYTVYSIHNTS